MCYFSRTLLLVPGRGTLPSTGRQFTGSERPASKTPICFQKEVFSLQWLGAGGALFKNDQVCSPNDSQEGGIFVYAQKSFTTVCVSQNSDGRNAWKRRGNGLPRTDHATFRINNSMIRKTSPGSYVIWQLLLHTRTYRHITYMSSSIFRPFFADKTELHEWC